MTTRRLLPGLIALVLPASGRHRTALSAATVTVRPADAETLCLPGLRESLRHEEVPLVRPYVRALKEIP
ncbi:hypothetical protein SLNWT_3207 [Streptomyces albus]|uniref:Uncharacterized protein n=1 Tax=Streptomyces albus (strain ATCC 21838 / DSM 41398 / FERM P-419 / JCM 4703 / NBRC 107858) TaxID=1081613 RepID=A0A0B5EMA9_STRA4|nr:hypothetical protein SLNWT_3207 [Streptomyces albus]AOU77891.1 hypothetical protein SLNHY_3200 [Streptomyces albus]AYN33647.1 hypothetical protein DUI70_3146 [Streptomyces albus]